MTDAPLRAAFIDEQARHRQSLAARSRRDAFCSVPAEPIEPGRRKGIRTRRPTRAMWIKGYPAKLFALARRCGKANAWDYYV
jgi:hypothetical protein